MFFEKLVKSIENGESSSTSHPLFSAFSKMDQRAHAREKFDEHIQEIERIRSEIKAEQEAFNQKIKEK